MGFLSGSGVKEFACNAGDTGAILGIWYITSVMLACWYTAARGISGYNIFERQFGKMNKNLVIFISFIPEIPDLRVDSKEIFGWEAHRILYKDIYYAINCNNPKLEAV